MEPWQGVSEFIKVADRLSFSEAAKELNISTAQVSRQIKQLESRLGSTLLYRTTRKVALTESGKMYLERCKPLIEALLQAEESIGQLQKVPIGELRITAPVTYGNQVVMPLLMQFMSEHPQLKIYCELSDKVVDIIDEGFDVAIRLGQVESDDLISKKLSTREIITCASPSYLQNQGEPVKPADLIKHQCLVGQSSEWRFTNKHGEQHFVNVSSNLRCNNGYSLANAAIDGFGIVHLPEYYVADAIEKNQLQAVLTQFKPQEEGICVMFPPGRQLSPKVRMLIEFLQEKIK